MNDSKLCSVAQVKAFLGCTQEVSFSASALAQDMRYEFIERTVKRFGYCTLGKADKGVIRAYLMHCTGYSVAQVTRLIGRCIAKPWQQALKKRYRAPTTAYKGKYTPQDLALLVEVDMAYDNACGSTTVAVLKRQYQRYGDQRFERLSGLSVSHLYNLRASQSYKKQRLAVSKTRTTQVPIGVRKAPQPNGHAGYIRVDSVHQGDQDKIKGVYHITCVDSVTQWDITCCVQGISEAYLLDALAQAMEQFPFEIRGFHTDNGSEYINTKVARMLNKLHIEQTKSRPRHSNDNALAESKNNSIVRRHMGYEYIPRQLATPINQFYMDTFNPWVNYHRPCLYATQTIDTRGKVIKKYHHKDTQTPLDKLSELCGTGHAFLKPGISLQGLRELADAQSDLAATQHMREQKALLWQRILKTRKNEHASATQNDATQAQSQAERMVA